jgi:hypothetical protein
METEDRQDAILAELQVIRRCVKAILRILALFAVIAVISAASPQLGAAVTFFGGCIVLIIIAGALVGIGAAKVVSRTVQ